MELLSPAGNIEKLRYAYQYGADAAYIGLRSFSLRARADNFDGSEPEEIRRIKGGRKLYGALNIFFHQRDLKELEEQLELIGAYPFDAFIVSDIGIVPILRRRFPNTPLHLSTQANCVNASAAAIYGDLGFSRIILGREVSLREISEIREALPDMELETFVHGAMCIAYSGRCLLSSYMAGRSGNRGDCAHSCRWEYALVERKRPEESFPVEQGENFTTILSSRDLKMIDHLGELEEAGVNSVKIEGRMKSVYYTAVVTRAYRKQIDLIEGRITDPEVVRPYVAELDEVSHREYSTGFYFGREEMEQHADGVYRRPYLFLGTIGEEVSPGRFRLELKNKIRTGEPVEYIGPDQPGSRDRRFLLYDEEGNPVEERDHGKETVIEPSLPVEPGFILRRRKGDPSVQRTER
ncbi:MAG: peptidase U32 family protein [Spirochaetaceae bacterium]